MGVAARMWPVGEDGVGDVEERLVDGRPFARDLGDDRRRERDQQREGRGAE